MNPLPYGRQCISESDVAAVMAVLRSDWLTQGPTVERFERKVADRCGAHYAVAVSSGTAALHLGALALGLKPGDNLWTSPNTFVASANCARYCGADVDFVDIDPLSYNLSADKLASKLESAASRGKLPKVVVPVAFAGQSCQMERIRALSQEYSFAVMEDASHALGARYQGRPVGDGRFSDLTILSFHPVKIITTGEGGMLLTNRSDLHEKLMRLRTHGITRDARFLTQPSRGPWYYEQLELGYNYRMTDLQAALGASQMDRLSEFVARRRALAARYNELLRKLPLTLPRQHPDTESSWHLYVIRLQLDRMRKSHRQVFEELRAQGMGVQLHYIPVPAQPYYRQLGFKPSDYPEAELYYREAISLPLFPAMSDQDQNRVCGILEEVLTD
ncbi:MAG TPA: UDP-4-amino-4,6-dideoxy-N-acetyl-beta-L-altrosamine transaminase [Candidatus Paceibacterota bacterium]|nr:UDP-4-amino-4,6-dideoxy-N-acetyl-beta-L-altrosamine transaminase [Verrucomicrobiota bacterium]HSA09926.1 UDP-4-amino-4,6-dideoxy-N-acetyl-beta-L-altrosamine transaminase [Candidatus Paceibacterota bacterium]